MAQSISVDVPANPAYTGIAFGATVYQLDGTTLYAAFSTTGWYEAPAGSGSWHHAGVNLPDVGGVVAVGISGTEYARESVGPAAQVVTGFATPADVTAAQEAIIDAQPTTNDIVSAILSAAIESGVTMQTIMQKLFAVNYGKFVANDPDNPTEIIHYAPDGTTVRATFTLTDTTREPV